MIVRMLVVVLLTGCDAIVGADCAPGLVWCEGRCLPRCGADAGVDGAIDAGEGLDGGEAGAPDGAVLDAEAGTPESEAGTPDGGGLDAEAGDGGGLDAGPPVDGGRPGCDIGELDCGGVCVDGLSDPMHCGDCDVACAAGELCAGGACVASCDPPSMICDGRCIDVRRDPDHCGACGNVCASGICIDGECSEALAGHVVVVGHDYASSRRGMNRIAGNAVFLARGNPVEVLVWEGGSTAASRTGTDAAIQQVALALGRSWSRVLAADAGKVPFQLASADVFLVYAQQSGSDAALRALGASWATALDSFVRRGGVVVLFETSAMSHAGGWQILDEAGLFEASGRTETTGSIITVTAPADAVALSVPLSYAAERTSVRFDTTETVVVARDATGPVVVHRTVVPP